MGSRYEYRYGKMIIASPLTFWIHRIVIFFNVWRLLLIAATLLFAGTLLVRNVTRLLPNSTTGGHRWGPSKANSCLTAAWVHWLFSLVASCPGYHICVWHHKRAVLSASGQVGQWCGWSKAVSLSSRAFTLVAPHRSRLVTFLCLLQSQWCPLHEVLSQGHVFVL